MSIRKMCLSVLILVLLATMTVSAQYEPFKVKLTMLERAMIMGMIPEKSSFANLKIFTDLKMELAPNTEEAILLDAKEAPGGGTNANWTAVPLKEITFGQITERLIIDALKKLDTENALSQGHASLYEKFVLRENIE